ncbi:MAG: hypothetical protein PHH37_05275 [Paludibacter sp.]|nr:hypothetical protein [Paludibacter sp.]
MRRLISKYESLKEQNDLLQVELERKQHDLMLAHKEILELRNDYDHLKIARSLVLSEDEKNVSKEKINKMVREIDKCIALLDE